MAKKKNDKTAGGREEKSREVLENELRIAHEELEKTNTELLQLTLELDDRVEERTRALKESEAELRKHRDHLRKLVDERTLKLRNTNARLVEKLNELRASEERFKGLVITIPDIVYRIDQNGIFTFINQAIKNLGYDPKELIGKHFSHIVFSSDLSRVSRREVIKRYAGEVNEENKRIKLFDERRRRDRKTTGLEVRLISKSKKLSPGVVERIGDDVVPVEINSAGIWQPSPDLKDRVFVGTVGVIRDVSERKKMENALFESEERFRTIFEHIEAGLVIIDPETRAIMDVNPAGLRMFGAGGKEVIGRSCHKFICPAEKGKCPVADLGRAIERSERVLLTADKQEIPILKTVSSITLNGRALFLESFVDISDLKTARETALAQGNLLGAINRVFIEALTCDNETELASRFLEVAQNLSGSRIGFTGELNPAGRLDTIAVSRTGWDACRISRPNAHEMLKNKEFKSDWGRIVLKGRPVIVNDPASHPERCGVPTGHPDITTFLGIPMIYKNNTIGMLALAGREGGYNDQDRHAAESLTAVFVEVLLRKRSELELSRYREHLEDLVEKRTAALKQSQMKLIQTEKVAALGTLTAGIAHELNNPLMGMLNFIQYCLKHTDENDRRYPVLADAEKETKRCSEIVKNLLTFSRAESRGEEGYTDTQLEEILERVLRLLDYRIATEGITVNRQVDPALPRVPVRPSAMQQVFLNIVGNAMDAVKDASVKIIDITLAAEADAALISIADTGMGISAEAMDKIFDPFFTTKPPGKGTGLGLSISYGIIESHGGRLDWSNEAGRGTVFTIRLPLRQKKNQ